MSGTKKVFSLVGSMLYLNRSQLRNLLLSYVLMPLILATFMLALMGGLSTSDSVNIRLDLQDEDQSPMSDVLRQAIEQSGFITLSSDAKLHLRLPQGFADRLSTDEPIFPELSADSKDQELEVKLVQSLIDQLGRELRFAARLEQELSTADLKPEEVLSFSKQINTLEEDLPELFQVEELDSSDNLGIMAQMRENIAATYMIYIVVVLAFSISSARVVERESGILKRSASVPVSSFHYMLADFLTYVIYSLLFCLIYLIVMRLVHSVLTGSLLLYLLIMGLTSCFFLGLVQFLSVLIRKDQLFQTVMGLVMFIYICMANAVSMAKPGESSDWVLGLAEIRPDKLILDACRHVRLASFTIADLVPNLILAAIGLFLVVLGAAIQAGRKEKI